MAREAIYDRKGNLFYPNSSAGSPWSEEMQHGGAVTGLCSRTAEEASRETGLQTVRLTTDLFRPVPMEPLACTWHFVRKGRRIANLQIDLKRPDEDQPICRASALLLGQRKELQRSWEPAIEPAPDFADTQLIELMPSAYRKNLPDGFHWSIQIRVPNLAEDRFAWITTSLDLVAGEETSPGVRCAAVSDLTFGLSGRILTNQNWTTDKTPKNMMINTDTTIYWERPPQGEWFAFGQPTLSDEHGIGLAGVVLYDELGRLGRCSQALIANSNFGTPEKET